MLKSLSKIFTGLALVTPLLINRTLYFPFISGKALTFRLLIEIALLLYLLHLLFSKDVKTELREFWLRFKKPIVICLGLVALLFIVGSIFSTNPDLAFWSNYERGEGAWQVLHYFLFFVLLTTLFRTKKDFQSLFLVAIFSGLGAAFYGLTQIPAFPRPEHIEIITTGDRASGTLGNASYLAANLLFTISLLGYFILRSKSQITQIVLSLGIFFSLTIFFQTGTRGAFFGLILGLLTILISNLFVPTRSTRAKRIILAVLLILILLASFAFITRNSENWSKLPIPDRYLDYQQAVRGIQPRLWTWSSGLAAAMERPWVGWGAENYGYPFDKYYNPNHLGHESYFDRTHNVFLEYWISGGIFLLLAHLATIFFAFRALAKQHKRGVFWSILLGLLVAYLIQGFFLFDFLVIYLNLYLVLAYINAYPHLEKGEDIKISKGQKIVLAGLIALLAINFFIVYIPSLFGLLFAAIGVTLLMSMDFDRESYRSDSLNFVFGGLVLAGILFSIYSTIYLPYRKNILITQAILERSILEKVTANIKAIEFDSPVGDPESVTNLQSFALELQDGIAQNGGQVDEATLRLVLDTANEYHDKYLSILPGTRTTYLNGAANLRAGSTFGIDDYLLRGKKLYEDVVEQFPTRIEFIDVLMKVANLQNDEERYTQLKAQADLLRPDINWPEYTGNPTSSANN